MVCLYPLTFQGTSSSFRRPLSVPDPTMSSFNPFSSNTTVSSRRNTVRSDRPPTYTSHATAVPPYTPNEQESSGAGDRSEMVSAWSRSLPSASSAGSQDSDTVFDQPESSVTDTVSIAETSTEMTRPPGPRYGEPLSKPYRNSLKVINPFSLLPTVCRGWPNSIEKPRLLR